MTPKEITALLDKAKDHIEKSEYSQAETIAAEVLALKSVSHQDKAQALCIAGFCDNNFSRFEDMLAQFAAALINAEAASDHSLQAKALIGTAFVQNKNGDFHPAQHNSELALQLAISIDDKKLQSDALNEIGLSYHNRPEYVLDPELLRAQSCPGRKNGLSESYSIGSSRYRSG